MSVRFQVLLIMFAVLVGFNFATAATATLGWNANSPANTAGYNVYYGTTSGDYTAKLNVGNVTSATISNLNAGATYYFSVTTVNTNGNESAFSAEITYLVPGLVTLSQRANASAPMMLQFSVSPGHWYEVQASTDLRTWATIGQTAVATANVWQPFSDTNAGAFSSRYYRLIVH